jgi:hypothetical protein
LSYRLNGSDLRMSIEDAFDLVTSVADGSLREVPEIGERLRPWVLNIAGKG